MSAAHNDWRNLRKRIEVLKEPQEKNLTTEETQEKSLTTDETSGKETKMMNKTRDALILEVRARTNQLRGTGDHQTGEINGKRAHTLLSACNPIGRAKCLSEEPRNDQMIGILAPSLGI